MIAIGLVAGDVSADTIARCCGVSRLEVIEAFSTARQFGPLSEDDSVTPGEAAVRYTLLVECYAGDQHSLAPLKRTECFDLSPDQAVRVAAARGLAEMRTPVLPDDGEQRAWITRPEAAQPLAQWSLDHSPSLSPETRAMALLAWRSTHRSPRCLAERLQVSRELIALTQDLRRPALQVDAAVYLAADAVESADRQLYDRALGVTRWLADSDGSARLSW